MAADLVARLAALHPPATILDGILAAITAHRALRSTAPKAAPPAFLAAIDAQLRNGDRPASIPAWLRACTDDLATHAWRRNPSYTDAAFLERYAYTELVGPTGNVACGTASFGLLALAPHTLYPPHCHPAVESYVVLLGTAAWQVNDGPWTTHPPGSLVHHPSGTHHAMRTADEPLLAAYLWTGDLATPARLVGASAGD